MQATVKLSSEAAAAATYFDILPTIIFFLVLSV